MDKLFYKDLQKFKKPELATLSKYILGSSKPINEQTLRELAHTQAIRHQKATMKSHQELGEEMVAMLEHATDWRDLQDIYIRFIKGDLPISPTHLGIITVDVQTTNIRNLLTMNELGFITVDSQPGQATSGTNDYGDAWITRERQYIEGFLHKDYVQSFIDNLETYSPEYGEYININITDSDNNNLYNNNHILDNDAIPPTTDRIPVTIAWDDNSGSWDVETSQPINYWDNPLGFLLQIDESRLETFDDYVQDNLLMVNIVAKPWAVVGILDTPVINALKATMSTPQKKKKKKISRKRI